MLKSKKEASIIFTPHRNGIELLEFNLLSSAVKISENCALFEIYTNTYISRHSESTLWHIFIAEYFFIATADIYG